MKKCSVVSTIFVFFVFLTACTDNKIIIPITYNPSAQPLLGTLTEIAKTVEAIAGTATAYSLSPTPTHTPTNTPDISEVNKAIANSIKNQLISTFGASITVQDVKFGPIGGQEYTNLYIEISCAGDSNAVCPVTNVIIAVMDAIKEKQKKVLENVPRSTKILTITIFDPTTHPKVVEINWPDVLAYVNGDLSGDAFRQRVNSIQY